MGILSDLKRNLFRKKTKCSLCNRPLAKIKWRDEDESDKEESFKEEFFGEGLICGSCDRLICEECSINGFSKDRSVLVAYGKCKCGANKLNIVPLRMSGSRAWLK